MRLLPTTRSTGLLAPLWAGALMICFVACEDPETITETRSAVEHGAELFADKGLSSAPGNVLSCADCHGESTAQVRFMGGSLAGATTRPSYWAGQEPSLIGAVNHCLYYFMLHDRDLLPTDEQARALYAFLESLTGPSEPIPFTIGLVADPGPGDAARGASLYGALCQNCHGTKTSGQLAKMPTAPVLPEETLQSHPSPDYTDAERRLVFVEKTRHGTFFGYGGQMPPFSLESLTDGELADILSYLGVP